MYCFNSNHSAGVTLHEVNIFYTSLHIKYIEKNVFGIISVHETFPFWEVW